VKVITIREARKRRGWTQDELAAKAGIDQTTISCIETRSVSPRFDTVMRLAKALGVRPEHLDFGQESVTR
jgi:transcriptional regulator with XRE-family HTH domain